MEINYIAITCINTKPWTISYVKEMVFLSRDEYIQRIDCTLIVVTDLILRGPLLTCMVALLERCRGEAPGRSGATMAGVAVDFFSFLVRGL